MIRKDKNVALVCGAPYNASPYLSYYVDYFNANHITFDLIFWNRNNEDYSSLPENFIHYDKKSYIFKKRILKLSDEFLFIRFAKSKIRQGRYRSIICFGIITPTLLYDILKNSTRYIIDIRDYSWVLKYTFVQNMFFRLVNGSYCTFVSSPGFNDWLPESCKYNVFHNCGFNYFINSKDHNVSLVKSRINILTIGQIRDFEPNTKLIGALANHPDFYFTMSGKGSQSLNIESFANENGIKNFSYTGPYKKEEELAIVEECDMINSVFGHDINSDSLLTNRLYLSVAMRKPFIVSKDCFQAKVVEKYNLGVSIDMNGDIVQQISSYCKRFNSEVYNKGCRDFISIVTEDINQVIKQLLNFTSN